MSQGEVIKLLEENGEMTCREISLRLEISPEAILKNLTSLLRAEEVEREKKSEKERIYIWRLKDE